MSERYVDFEVIKEGWSVYELQDGTKIKVRFTLQSVKGKERTRKMKYEIMIICLCDESVQGKPTKEKYTQAQMRQSVDIANCKYVTRHYEPSEYILDDNTHIIVHHNVLNIARTHLFDEEGDRIYNTDADVHLTNKVTSN